MAERANRATAAGERRGPGRLRLVAWAVPVLFFVEAAVLGLRIVPRWEIPDETAHFAYARNLWTGKGIGRFGEAKIEADIATDLFQHPSPAVDNWAVQHPPLYYWLAGAAWKLATLITSDSNWLFRAPRLVSSFFGALTIFFIYKIIERARQGVPAAIAVAASFAAVPTFAWMSAGTNNDTMVAAFGTASAWQFADFMLGRRQRSAWLSVLLMSLAAATKITALPALAVLVGCLALEAGLSGGALRWLGTVAAWSAAGLALPGMWLARNQALYGTPVAHFPRLMGAYVLEDKPLQVGFAAFLATTTQIEDLFVNFVGRIGWIGKGASLHTWFPIGAPYLTAYEIAGLLVSALAAAWSVRAIRFALDGRAGEPEPASMLAYLQRRIPRPIRYGLMLLVAMAAACAAVLAHRIVSASNASWLLVPIVSLCLWLGVVAVTVLTLPLGDARRLAFYSVLICAFLGMVLLVQGHSAYLLDGELHFAHGRYLYPVLGYLVAGLVVPALLALGRFADRAASAVAAVIWLTGALFFLKVAMPYALGGL